MENKMEEIEYILNTQNNDIEVKFYIDENANITIDTYINTPNFSNVNRLFIPLDNDHVSIIQRIGQEYNSFYNKKRNVMVDPRTFLVPETIHTFYHHIDNGGITINFVMNEYGTTTISTSTDYFGYPSASYKIIMPAGNDSLIKEIGDAYINFYYEINHHVSKYLANR